MGRHPAGRRPTQGETRAGLRWEWCGVRRLGIRRVMSRRHHSGLWACPPTGAVVMGEGDALAVEKVGALALVRRVVPCGGKGWQERARVRVARCGGGANVERCATHLPSAPSK